jgi:hypothetical protein
MTQPVAKKATPLTVNPWLPALGLALLLSGCSGASSTAGAQGSSSGPFVVSQVSVSSGGVWQINRPIQFTFSLPVDFDTVNLNTISIQRLNGQPAVGEFTPDPASPRSVIFQPVCPTQEDFSDAGLKPGGVIYQIDLPTSSSGATSVHATNGKALTTGYTLTFSTPTSTVLADIFLDPLPGPPRPVVSPGTGTLLRTKSAEPGMPPSDTYFAIQPNGTGALPAGFLVKNNFYSDAGTQVEMHVRFDQPVSPLAENINSGRLQLQYFDQNSIWRPLTTEVTLTSNCAGTGSSVRISPVGILPQGRPMRLLVTPEFEDLVGDRNTTPLDQFGLMTADAALDGGGSPVDTADEVLDHYLDKEFEDQSAALSAPSAKWGPSGLEAAFAFDGTGGPGGQFDLHIAPNSDVIFDTTSTLFFGGPGGVPQFSQLAVNGRLDVRDLKIPATSTLRIQGPNSALILASGTVTIEGRLACDGGHAAPVFTLDTPNQPESGGAGQATGGDGGVGSFLTTQVTPRGGNGQGAGGAANLGGEGGESGWSTDTSSSGINRRPGGGGGGRFGHDQQVLWTGTGAPPGGALCDDQAIYGLDAESGFVGSDQATSSQGQHIPYGGHDGPGPFGLFPGTSDDFFGTKIEAIGTASEKLVAGELSKATGGSGGGAGGDATRVPVNGSYPPPLIYVDQDKGAGGGGGAGALTILALGDIKVTSTGKISAIGGHGSGGENTSGVNRIGGGSGGGSGGHLILQTASRIDLSSVPTGFKGIDARGGQGGVGAGDNGGAGSFELAQINKDAKHPGFGNGLGSDNPWDVFDASCINYMNSLSASQTYTIRCAGGDGGPGLVQLHVGTLATDILYPTNVASLQTVVQPVPHGYDFIQSKWVDHLLPVFGRLSMSQSRWIALGEPTIDPVSATLGEVSFLFDGTTAGGLVEDVDMDQMVDALPPILTQAIVLAPDPTFRTVILDPTLLAAPDQIYVQNPKLLRSFTLTAGGIPYNVGGAVLNPGDAMLHVTISDEGASLQNVVGNVELRPRYYAVTTTGIPNSLPSSASIRIQFDLAEADAADSSLPSTTLTTGFVNHVAGVDLNTLGVDPKKVRFMRYRVTFDITQGTAPLNFNTPRPRLDFLRLPFRF